jgi:two-component system, NarL family, nitrate/nitrite response regulator NarL
VIDVFIVGDVALHLDGVATILAGDGRVRVVGSAPLPIRAPAELRDLRPQVVLLDAAAPDRLTEAHRIHEEAPEACIVALAVPDEEDEVVSCAEAGISGCVRPDASVDELVRMIYGAVQGEARCSPRVTSALMRRLAALAGRPSRARGVEPLTCREQEIFDLMAQGLSNKEIGQRLGIELPTVKTHVHHVLAKLQLRRRTEVAALGRAPGRPRRLPPGSLAAISVDLVLQVIPISI